jgi:membrane-associated phospholipid phosphatase
MLFISDFGDSAVLLPLALFLIVVLWRYQSWPAAVSLIQALGICLATLVMLKVAFIVCGASWHAGIGSPSGHAGMSAMIYGALGVVAARQTSWWQRPVIFLAVWLLVAGIAMSRVALGAHSYAEVVIGVLAGVAALAYFLFRYLRLPDRKMNWALIATTLCAGLLVLHGIHAPLEQLIRHLALATRAMTGACTGA